MSREVNDLTHILNVLPCLLLSEYIAGEEKWNWRKQLGNYFNCTGREEMTVAQITVVEVVNELGLGWCEGLCMHFEDRINKICQGEDEQKRKIGLLFSQRKWNDGLAIY